jgi:Fe-S-cluster containining protein
MSTIEKQQTGCRVDDPFLAPLSEDELDQASMMAAGFAEALRQCAGPAGLALVGSGAAMAFDHARTEILKATRKAKAPAPACKAGCSACCTLLVSCSVPELVSIVIYIAENWNAKDVADMFAKLREAGEKVRGLTAADRHKLRMPCPMLKDGNCSVYAARPLACRAYNSLSRQACIRSSMEPESSPTITVNPKMFRAGFVLNYAIAEALLDCGLDPCGVELITGLLEVLTNPASLERWLQGEPAFA